MKMSEHKGAMRKVARAAKAVLKKVSPRKVARGAKKAANMATRLAKGKY